MVLLQNTCTIEIKEWVPSLNSCEQIYQETPPPPPKQKQKKKKKPQTNPSPICNFKIVELIIDMIVNSTVNNKQINTLSWAICMKIKTLSLRGCQLISVSFWAY